MAYGNTNVPGPSETEMQALKESAQAASDKIGTTGDTGGSVSGGTVFGKLNTIIEQNNEQKKGNVFHHIWLNDYKTFGEDSYVFQSKEILHELYADSELCMNDGYMAPEVLEYANKNNLVGQYLSHIYGIANADVLVGLNTMEEICASDVAMNTIAANPYVANVIANSEVAMKKICQSVSAMEKIVNSQVAMTSIFESDSKQFAINAITASASLMELVLSSESVTSIVLASDMALASIVASKDALNEVLKSEFAMTILSSSEIAMDMLTTSGTALQCIAKCNSSWQILKPFMVSLNNNDDYIRNVYNILNDASLFTLKVEDYADYGASALNSKCTKDSAANGFIACSLGKGDSGSDIYCAMSINGIEIKRSGANYNERKVQLYNVNAIGIPDTTFTGHYSGIAAIAVYISK